MKNYYRRLFVCFLSFCILILASPTMTEMHISNITDKFKTTSVPFIANNGQVDDDVSFYANTLGGTLFVMKSGELVYNLRKVESSKAELDTEKKEIIFSCGVVIREHLINARVSTITASRESVTKVHYFKGNDSSKWLNGITTYGGLSLGKIYKGIEMLLLAHGDNVEKLFYVSPEANPDLIKLAITGANGLKVLDTGELLASTPLGDIRFTKPIAWQEKNGERVQVTVSYEIISGDENLVYGFKVGSYDQAASLFIDPLLASTFLGGTESERASSIAIDSTGNVYVTGFTNSTDYPTTTGAYDQTYNGYGLNDHDIIISKFTSDLSTLLASAYLGGTGREGASSIAIDSTGNVYVTGKSNSTDYPTTAGAYDQIYDGDGYIHDDIVISKFTSDLSTLLASTYLGGTVDDEASSIALDSIGNVYVTGKSNSTDYPTTVEAYDQIHNGFYDIVISKFTSDLSTLLASTYLGGTNWEGESSIGIKGASSIALDSIGNVYVTGESSSTDYPTTPGTYDQSNNGNSDLVLSKLTSDLSTLLASTYLGGTGYDHAPCITLDSTGNVHVTGNSGSKDYPTTLGAYDQTKNSIYSFDIVISKLTSDLSTLLASTYLGGSTRNLGSSITLDSSDNVYVMGHSYSTYISSADYPITPGAYDQTYNGRDDIVISKLTSDLSTLLASTYLGGTGFESASSIALDSIGNVYVTGYSESTDYPTTAGAYDQTFNGDWRNDIVISKLSSDLLTTYTVSAYAGADGSLDVNTPSLQTVTYGFTTQFTFNADHDYHIASIFGCGVNYTNTDIAIANVAVTTEAITADCTVNATFVSNTYGLLSIAIEGKGAGRVTSNPGTINCPGICNEEFVYGTYVTLTAVPDKSSSFVGWSGGCVGTDLTCEVNIDLTIYPTKNVTAHFKSFSWAMFMPAIIGKSCRINSFWGAYSIVCCRSSSATFSVTISGQTKQSYKPSCGVAATWEGWERVTPGKKSVYWRVTSPTCRTYGGSFPWVLEKGKVYFFRLEFEDEKLIVYVYRGDACNVLQNDQATRLKSMTKGAIGMETKSFKLVDKINLDIPSDAFKANNLPMKSYQTDP